MKKILLNSIVVLAGLLLGVATGGYVSYHRYSQKFATERAFAYLQIFLAATSNRRVEIELVV